MPQITRESVKYPRRLVMTTDAPGVLYHQGSVPLNAPRSVAIVGTRSATPYALRFINTLVDDIAASLPGTLIVSGLALGCDIMAHRRAVEKGLPTVAVLGHGLHMIYPAANARFARAMVDAGHGMLLSAYPDGTPVQRGYFLERNKIIAGLADCVVVAESAADHGGSLYTARYAAAMGRRVFACPGRIGDRYSAGCNMLIRDGIASLCESAADLINTMGWQAEPVTTPGTPVQQSLFPTAPSGIAAQVAAYLTEHPDSTADQICQALDIPMPRLLPTLMEMEFLDQIMTLPGNRFRNA